MKTSQWPSTSQVNRATRQLYGLWTRRDARVVVEPFEVGHEIGDVSRGVVRPFHDLDKRLEGVLGQREDRRRLAGLEELSQSLDNLANAVCPLPRGVLGTVAALGQVEDRRIDRPLKRLEVDGCRSPLRRLDEKPVPQFVVTSGVRQQHLDKLIRRQGTQIRLELFGRTLGQLGHELSGRVCVCR